MNPENGRSAHYQVCDFTFQLLHIFTLSGTRSFWIKPINTGISPLRRLDDPEYYQGNFTVITGMAKTGLSRMPYEKKIWCYIKRKGTRSD